MLDNNNNDSSECRRNEIKKLLFYDCHQSLRGRWAILCYTNFPKWKMLWMRGRMGGSWRGVSKEGKPTTTTTHLNHIIVIYRRLDELEEWEGRGRGSDMNGPRENPLKINYEIVKNSAMIIVNLWITWSTSQSKFSFSI